MNPLARFILVLLIFVAGLLAIAPTARAVTLQSSTIATGTFRFNGVVNYDIVLEGTLPAPEGPYPYIVYVTGSDIYGNTTFIEVERGNATGLQGEIPNPGGTPTKATTFRIKGGWVVPTDGTLYNIQAGYRMVVAVYATAFPTTLAELTTTIVSTSASPIKIDVTPNLAINVPGITYPAGSYRGKDIIQFTGSWFNDASGETRPLRSDTTSDQYTIGMRLTTDAEYRVDSGTNDDFNLLAWFFSGDGPLIPDGTTQYRKIVVSGTPGRIEPYGILDNSNLPATITGTDRDYTPQPDDGYLDLGETVALSAECIIPENYSGRYFVAARVEMDNPDFDRAPNDNTFVSNAANKIEILETASPTIEAASAVSKENGDFVQGGDAASDYGSVNESGDIIAFASRAGNLLVPPSAAGASVPAQYATYGQQIFMKYRQTREVFLASRNSSNLQANADCFNPMVSADGRYVAYDSTAANLVTEATGGRSMIYVFDVKNFGTVNVAKNAQGEPANGNCLNPSISESGRFVAFESIATNLDLPQFTATLSGSGISSTFIKVRGGAGGYNVAAPPAVTFTGGGGTGAAATATVGANGTITGLNWKSAGSGYTSAPTITIAPPPAGAGQIFLHDRDTDANGVFDESGKIATYLVSVNKAGAVANGVSDAPAINLDDSTADITANGGVYVAFVSVARNMPQGTGNKMVYRTRVNVTGAASTRGPVLSSVTEVSVNDLNEPAALSTAEITAGLKADSYEPAINGDGSQIAFTSWGSNLVYNTSTGLFDADTNGVQDIFVRNFRPVVPVTTRVSVSQERVATGTITFMATSAPGNIPDNQPAIGDTITISDGVTSKTFTFAAIGGGDNVPVGASVQETRDNLVAVINASGLDVIAVATNPPNVNPPGTGYWPSIYLKNLVPGTAGNAAMTASNPNVLITGMAGGGTQAEDAPVAVQGVLFGSNQPSIDRSGRFVSFRSIAENLDVHIATDANSYPTSPITGELIRPLLFPTSNVYVHDRLADADDARDFDLTDNVTTTRVSVNKFGYETKIFGTEIFGLEATTSANSSAPSISANGRFVAFSSDSEGAGGLIFGLNNMTPLDNTKFRDVFVHDRLSVGPNPDEPGTRPLVEIIAPSDGLIVAPGTEVPIRASARAMAGKTISSLELFVDNVSDGVLTQEPYEWTHTFYNTGTYNVRVTATDSKGLSRDASIIVNVQNAGAGAPMIFMTQPVGMINYVTGSRFFLNAQVTATAPATIDESSIKFTANGVVISESIGKLGNRYGVLYTPTVPDTVDSLRAEATDSLARLGFSPPIFSRLRIMRDLPPTIEIIPPKPLSPVNGGGVITLQAKATFPDSGATDESVEFYVNKVFVGTATAGAILDDGSVLYTYDWRTPAIADDPSKTKITYDVYARAGDIGTHYTTYYSSVVSGPEPLSVYYVPPTPTPGSNEQFIIDYFQRVNFRRPTYDELSTYLAMFDRGETQADVVTAMFNDAGFKANQQVLFGYYLRMGLTPNVSQLPNLLSTMTNAAGTVLLPSTMSASVTLSNISSPYGATVGQSQVAQALINSVTKTWNGSAVKSLDNQSFMNWMLRSFNQPYLPQDFPTNKTVAWSGNQSSILSTIGSYSPTNTKFGATYAFMSALYASMPSNNIADTNLRATLTNFGPLVQGIAATYLLSPNTNNWATNAGPISTNMVSRLLPPYITNKGTNSIPVNVLYSNAIGGQNLFSNTVYYGSNLPAGIKATNIAGTGYIIGTPTVPDTTNTATIFASNGPGLVGSNSLTFVVLPAPPIVDAATFTGVAWEPFVAVVSASNSPTNFVVHATNPLPRGLSINSSNGVISGTPTEAGTTTHGISAFNGGGFASADIVIKLNPAFASYTAKYKLTGTNAATGADPDKDGYSNLKEFAFGMDPSRPSGQPCSFTKSGNTLTITWTRRKNNVLMIYAVQSTPTLSGPQVSWSSVSPQPTPQLVSDVDEDYERVKVDVSTSGSAGFYRVETSLPRAVLP